MSSSSARDVCHVWELGGNSLAFAELTSIVLTPQRLPTCVVVLVLDLTRSADALASGARWLGALRARMAEVLERIAKAGARKGPAAAAAGGGAGAGGAGAGGGAGGAAGAAGGAGAGGMAGLSGDAAVEHLRNMATLRRRVGWAQRSGSALAVTLPASAAAAAGGVPGAPGSAEAQSRTLTDLRSPALTPAAVASLLASVPEHPDARVVASTTLPCQLLVVGARSDGPAIRDADSVRRKVVFSALRYLAHCHGGALVTTSSRDRASLAGFRGLASSLAFGSDARRGAQTDSASGRPLYIPAGADVIESIGAPVAVAGSSGAAAGAGGGASRAEIDNGGASFDARFERFLAPARQFFPPTPPGGPGAEWDEADPATALPAPSSIAPGASITFADEASRHPEPLIDSLRVQRAEEAARYAREAERRLRLEAKASATGAPGSGGSGAS